jgi:hypothetical protein
MTGFGKVRDLEREDERGKEKEGRGRGGHTLGGGERGREGATR